jgi:AcrR family transcriptional regulator
MVAYYFGDRDGLHEAMFARALDRASEQMARIMADGQEGTDTLDAFIHMHVSLLAHDPWIPQFIAREVLACATPHRERFVEHVGAGPLTMLADWIEAAIERRELRSDLDPRLCALSIASMTALPFLILPIIGKEFGLTLDALTPEDLIEHNRSLLNFGLRAQTAGPK